MLVNFFFLNLADGWETIGLVECGMSQSSVTRRFDKRPSIMIVYGQSISKLKMWIMDRVKLLNLKSYKTDGSFFLVTQVHKSDL